jgi:DNA-binding GntR family transcriptional regulator
MRVASPRRKTKGSASRVPPGSGPKLSLTERVYAALKKDIITGELMPGQAFTENDLAQRYTASRTPVREAAVRLQAEELVRIVANRGYFVTQLTIQEINDVYEYRAALESACAEILCGVKIPPQALSELERTACFRADDGKFAAFIAADTAFHVGIARLTHNALLARAVSQMRAQTERIMFAAAESIDSRFYGELPARQHMAILRAILRKDPEPARRLMREHIIGGKNKALEFARSDLRFL